MKARRGRRGPSAIELVEEAVHLLRQTSTATWCVYLAGTAPFALGLMFFWARVAWFRPSDFMIGWSAVSLVALFAVMKAAQAFFCARLLAQRLGCPAPSWSLGRWARVGAAQLSVQAWGLLLLPVAIIVGVPFGWTFAYFQSASVLTSADSLSREARDHAQLWPGQNHLGQLLISGVWLATWINVAAAFWMVPWLANRLLGIDNLFGFSGWWIANSTFVASTAVMSWLAVDPLVKAFFTLRVFYARARETGEDLRVEWSRAGVLTRSWVRTAALLVLSLWLLPAAGRLSAAESIQPVRAVEPAPLDGAIDRVLRGRDFEWRLRPLPRDEADTAGPEGWLRRSVRVAADAMDNIFHWLRGVWRTLREWLSGVLPGKSPADQAAAPGGMAALEIALWIFVVLLAGLLISVAVLAWRRGRLVRNSPVLSATPVAAAIPDLQDEKTQAAQLSVDGWLGLAREQLGRGEWRLAWRALYLATLARLADQGMISLTKFKTNLDYERELQRRAVTRGETVQWFRTKRGAFESVWYGRAVAEEQWAREWLAELERSSSP